MKKKKKTFAKRLSDLWWGVGFSVRYGKGHWIFTFLAIPFVVAGGLLASYVPKVFVDSLSSGDSLQSFGRVLILWMSLWAFCTAGDKFFYYFSNGYNSAARNKMRILLREKEAKITYETAQTQAFREVMGYAERSLERGRECPVDYALVDSSYTFVMNLLALLISAALIATLQPLLMVVCLLTAILSFFPMRWPDRYYEKNKGRYEKEDRRLTWLTGLSARFDEGHDVRLYHMQPWLEKLAEDYQSICELFMKKTKLRQFWAQIIGGFLTLVQNGAAYFFLITLVLSGEISVGDFVFFFGIVGTLSQKLQSLLKSFADLTMLSDKLAYYRDVLDYPDPLAPEGGHALPKAGKPLSIVFDHVSFRYEGAEEDTLHDFSLKIAPGESLSLVGLNGAGKTTFIKLLCGLYRPYEGKILVGGVDIRKFSAEDYASLLSAVFQDMPPLAMTIEEFVTCESDLTDEKRARMKSALTSAGLWEKVSGLPEGEKTHLVRGVYPDAVELSGGENQRLHLARAVYKDAPILLLDEPTSALDPIAENEIYLRYRELTKGKTSIYISHRFASTRFCSRIILLEHGRIIEEGTHEELMKLNRKYAELFHTQSRYYAAKGGKLDANEDL